MTLEHCPPSAWNRVRHRVEYAAYLFELWKQEVVLSVDMGNQIVAELCDACVQCPPCIASTLWRSRIV